MVNGVLEYVSMEGKMINFYFDVVGKVISDIVFINVNYNFIILIYLDLNGKIIILFVVKDGM